MTRPRRSKPTNGFPSKDLVGVRAQRLMQIQALMASGQWRGKLTEIALAREWGLSLDYVAQLASDASAQLQVNLTTDFAASLRSRLLHATEAITGKLVEVMEDADRHGSYDRYEASEDGVHWFEVPRKKALEEEFQKSVKVRRIPCTPLASLPSFAMAAFKGLEAVDRLASAIPASGGPGEAGGGPSRPAINIIYDRTVEPGPETPSAPGEPSKP